MFCCCRLESISVAWQQDPAKGPVKELLSQVFPVAGSEIQRGRDHQGEVVDDRTFKQRESQVLILLPSLEIM